MEERIRGDQLLHSAVEWILKYAPANRVRIRDDERWAVEIVLFGDPCGTTGGTTRVRWMRRG